MTLASMTGAEWAGTEAVLRKRINRPRHASWWGLWSSCYSSRNPMPPLLPRNRRAVDGGRRAADGQREAVAGEVDFVVGRREERVERVEVCRANRQHRPHFLLKLFDRQRGIPDLRGCYAAGPRLAAAANVPIPDR